MTATEMSEASFKRRFKVIHELGSGTFGRVEKVYDKQLGRVVALKTVSPSLMREVTVMKSVNHNSIISFYEAFLVGEELKISMEFCGNSSMVYHKARMTPLMVQCIVRDVASALAELHSKNIIHFDVKPQNILMTSIGEVKLSDFGISRCEDSIVTSKDLSGTAFYMAPELLRGEKATIKIDVWALGITAFELITGVPLALTKCESFGSWIEKNQNEVQNNGKWNQELVDLISEMLNGDKVCRIAADDIAKRLNHLPATWIVAGTTINNGDLITPKSHLFWE